MNAINTSLIDEYPALGVKDRRNDKKGMVDYIPSFVKKSAEVLIDYFKADSCRSIFVASASALAIATGSYIDADHKKSQMQDYLVAKISVEAAQNSNTMLEDSKNGLFSLLQNTSGSSKDIDTALEYAANIEKYSHNSDISPSFNMFSGKLGTVKEDVRSYFLSNIHKEYGSDSVSGVPKSHLDLQITADILTGMIDSNKSIIGKKLAELKDHAGEDYVGKVGIYNATMDASVKAGLMAAVLAVSMIPGMGIYRRTGYC